jgi:hypothetical protein
VAGALTDRRWLDATLLAGLAALLGAFIATQPQIAVAFMALVVVTVLAFLAPTVHLALLIALTAIVPYSLENKYSPGSGGSGTAGLVASDLFLLTGLFRVALVMPGMRLDRRRLIVVALVLAFVAFTAFEAIRGLRSGHTLSDVGADVRALGGGFASVLIAMTVLDRPGGVRRVMRMLVVLGLALGLWGVAQWAFQISFGGDFGVRAGVDLTSGGRGQVQGGLFSFPVAVIVATAALASGRLRGGLARWSVVAVLVLNAVSLLLTFERTFWVAAVIGVLIVALRSGRSRRARTLLWIAVLGTTGLLVLSAVSPGTLKTAEQRLFSIGAYQVDNSVRFRVVESGFVIDKIKAKPLTGWGLADTIYWGQPWQQTPPASQAYSHVGYLWLFWREGLLGGAILLALLVLSALWPGRAVAGPLANAVKVGCQASLVALLVIDFVFPAFQGPEGTYMLGLLIAFCAIPVVRRGSRSAAG